MKRLISFMMALVMLISAVCCVNFNVFADDQWNYETWLQRVSEKQAYEKGFDYYMTWHMVNKGNFEDQFIDHTFKPGYVSTVFNNRNSASYRQAVTYWRMMTLEFDEWNHSNKEKAYTEAMLFNLLYDEGSGSFYPTFTSNYTDVVGSVRSLVEKHGFSQMSKILKLNGELNKSVKLQGEVSEQFVETMIKSDGLSGLGSAVGTASNAMKLLGYVETVGEYVDGLAKLQEICGHNQYISDLLADCVELTENEAYKSTFSNFSDYLDESISYEQAAAIFSGETALREAMDIAPQAVWNILKKKVPTLFAVDAAASLGKFAANELNPLDAQYSKFSELEVYFDFQFILAYDLFLMAEKAAQGDEYAASKYYVGYRLYQKVVNEAFNCWLEYCNIMYEQGLLNKIMPSVNGGKYDEILNEAEKLRDAWNASIDDDYHKAESDYAKCSERYEDRLEGVGCYALPINDAEEKKEYVQQNQDTFYFDVKKDKTIYSDKEIYGVVNLESGTLNTNGHKLTIYGNVFIGSGTFSNNGIVEVKGSIIQTGGSVTIPGNSYLFIDGNYEQKGGGLNINGGKLTVGGSHIIGTAEKDTYPYFDMTNSGEEIIGGDFLVNYLYGSNDNYGRTKPFYNGKITVGGNAEMYNFSVTPHIYEDFTFIFDGAKDLTLRNIYSGNIVINNASERNITFAEAVQTADLSGGDMTVTPENLKFGATLENDVIINGDMEINSATVSTPILNYSSTSWDNPLNLNSHKLTVNGDVKQTGGSVSADADFTVNGKYTQTSGSLTSAVNGNVTIRDDYEQKGGGLKIEGGKLTVGGNHIIGTAEKDTYPYFDMTNSGEETVGGDFLVNYLYGSNDNYGRTKPFYNGKITVGGNAEMYNFSVTPHIYEDFTFIFDGTKDLTLRNIYSGNIVINNASERNITFAEAVQTAYLSGGDMTVTPENLKFGAKLENDLTINGKAEIKNNTNLNLHKLTVNGDVTQTGGSVSADADFTVNGKYTQTSGSLTSAVNGNVTIRDDYEQKGGGLKIEGGKLTVGGNHIIGTAEKNTFPYFDMTNSGEETVGGDFLVNYLYGSNDNYGRTKPFYNGKITVGGNAEMYNFSVTPHIYEDFTFIFDGTKDLTLRNIYSGNIVINNAADRKITFAENIQAAKLSGGDMSVTPENLIFGATLENDVTVNGDMRVARAWIYRESQYSSYSYSNDLNLNGHKLTVNGNVMQTDGLLNINNGQLDISGNYDINNSASINMSKADDRVNVSGDMSVNSSCASTLTDGILSLKGDFTQDGTKNSKNFLASGNHMTYLDGNGLQKITFGTYPSSKFNNVELFQFEENYMFSPEVCWNNMRIHCDHTNTEIRDAVEVTCLENGYSGDTYCADCGDLLETGTVIKATGHKTVIDEAIAASCTEDGKTAGRHCSECGAVFKAQEVIYATGHKGEWTVVKEATCSEEGREEIVCTVCGEMDSRAIEKLPHTEETMKSVAPTCTKAGLSEGKKCSVCGEILEEQQTINALGHTYEATVVEPTCISGGYTVYTCSVCGDTYRSDYTGISEHEYRRIVTQEATCKNEGIAKYICIVCSDTYTETIARTEHSIVTDNAVESTCTTEGLTQGSHCSVCGEVFVAQEKIKAKEHTPSKAIKENIIVSTYTRAGSYENVVYCSVCNAEISRKKVTLAKLPKKANTLTVKGKTATVKYSSLKKNNQTVAQKNAFTISKAQGKVTYKKSSGNSKITVSSAGKITVKKGLKKGTYTVKVKVSAAGNATYKAATKTATVTIKVK